MVIASGKLGGGGSVIKGATISSLLLNALVILIDRVGWWRISYGGGNTV